jgi:hypothetical protein
VFDPFTHVRKVRAPWSNCLVCLPMTVTSSMTGRRRQLRRQRPKARSGWGREEDPRQGHGYGRPHTDGRFHTGCAGGCGGASVDEEGEEMRKDLGSVVNPLLGCAAGVHLRTRVRVYGCNQRC